VSRDCLSCIAVLVIAAGIGCATAASVEQTGTVPRSAGTLAASIACRVTGAWTLDGQAVKAPTVTRCVLPWFPEAMRAAGQEGEIVWRIAVDSAGVPDASSLQIVRTSSQALVAAVAQAAPFLRFAGSSARGSVIVELPTAFQLTR
jgi:hypothetical protein